MKPYIFKDPRFELFGSPGLFVQNVYSRASGGYLGYVAHKKEGWNFWRVGKREPDKRVYKSREEAAYALLYTWIEAQ